MHDLIEREQMRWRNYIKEVEALEPICQKYDVVKIALKEVEGFDGINCSVNSSHIEVYISVKHTKAISPCLKVLHSILGERTYTLVTTSAKRFNFDFGDFWAFFMLVGDSCKLVKVGEETLKKDVFELRCGDELAETITEVEEIEVDKDA